MKKHIQSKRKALRVGEKQETLLIDDIINNHETIEEKDSSSLSRFGAGARQGKSRMGVRQTPPQYEQTWNTIDRGTEHENLLEEDSG